MQVLNRTLLSLNRTNTDGEKDLRRAADCLRAGGVVAFPTETYYGLAVDPFNRAALQRLFQVKKRPINLPILVLVAGVEQLPLLARETPAAYRLLIRQYWPGALTLLFPAQPELLPELTGQTGTVGIRYSPNRTANGLIATVGTPITATSANISGSPAAVSANEVADIFGQAIDLILDGGRTPGGKGSTLVGFRDHSLYCLRDGHLPFKAIQSWYESETVSRRADGGGAI